MVEAEKELKVMAPMSPTERALVKKLTDVKQPHPYDANAAKRLLDLAKTMAKGRDVTADLNSPFNQQIRKSDVNEVAKVLAMGKRPEDQAEAIAKLAIRGPQTSPEPVKQEVPGGAVQLYRVKIDGDRTYNISVRPGGDPKKIADVTTATVVDPVSGNKIDVTAAFQKAFENADSEAIHIFKPIVPRKLQ